MFNETNDIMVNVEAAFDLGNELSQNSFTEDEKGNIISLSSYPLTEQDIITIRNFLSNAKVLEWEDINEYGNPEMLALIGGEGYNWYLYIQYLDGSATYKYGKGTSKEI